MDDIVETMFLNMFFQTKLSAMPPKLLSDDKCNVAIRPLTYCRGKGHRTGYTRPGVAHHPEKPMRLSRRSEATSCKGNA